MARPLTASDDDILQAAGTVISRRGPDAFSLAEVASEVGLSRAAIILRFKSTHALKVTLLTRMVERFAADMDTLPKTPSGDNLLRVAAFIGSYMRSRENGSKFFATYSLHLRDGELMTLERKRGETLHEAIANVMPAVAVSHTAAVNAFRNHITGNIMAWLSLDDNDSDARSYMVRRTTEWLQLVGIPFGKDVVKELLAGSMAATAESNVGRLGSSVGGDKVGRASTKADQKSDATPRGARRAGSKSGRPAKRTPKHD